MYNFSILIKLVWAVLLGSILLVSAKKESDIPKPFPNRSTKPILSSDKLRIVAELPARPGNIDVDPKSGKVFFTFHPFGKVETSCKVCVLLEKFLGYEPFGDQSLFKTVLSVRVAKSKRQLLALDHKNFGETTPTLYVFDIETAELLKSYEFPPNIAGKGSFLNDFVVSKDENFIFIADSGIDAPPSIITVEMKSWSSKKALVDHESTKRRPTPKNYSMDGVQYEFSFQVGVDSIGLSPDGNMLYFGAIFDPYMWMVPTRSLVQGKGQPEEAVDVSFPKPASDGIVVDEDTGLLYVTDFQNSAIWVTDPTVPGRAKTLIANSKLLRWPDGLSASRGYLWVTASALHEMFQNPPQESPPFHILRLPLMMPQAKPNKGLEKMIKEQIEKRLAEQKLEL